MSYPDKARIGIALACASFGAAISLYFWSLPHPLPSDFSQVWAGARALWRGESPYSAVGPTTQSFSFGWRTPYPLPAFLIGMPFTALPLRIADALFVGLGAAALAWAMTRERWNDPRLLVFASFGYLNAAQMLQWSPLLTAAAVIPSLGFVLAAKPTIGAGPLAGVSVVALGPPRGESVCRLVHGPPALAQ
jgi:hypothetical protein